LEAPATCLGIFTAPFDLAGDPENVNPSFIRRQRQQLFVCGFADS
jgi:hypothetical protein